MDKENGKGQVDKSPHQLTAEIAALKAYIKDAIRSIQVSKDLRESPTLQNKVRSWVKKMTTEMTSLEGKGAHPADIASILEEINQFNHFVVAAEEKNRAHVKQEVADEIDAYIHPRKERYQQKNLPKTLNEIFEKFNQLVTSLNLLKENCLDKSEFVIVEEMKILFSGFNVLPLLDRITHKDPGHHHEEFSKQEKYLCLKLTELFKHGAKLLLSENATEKALGQLTCDLASDLIYKSQTFFNDRILKSQKKEREHFVKDLTRILHSQDKAMQLHRSYVKKTIANIMIGLGLIFSVVGFVAYIGIKRENPFNFFRKPKTTRTNKIEEIEKIALNFE